ncbi:MAG: hypothetical protein JNK08_08595 [Sediminibacterium sp.]|nr:hypothetical protein [Sediminibacterium sp.]
MKLIFTLTSLLFFIIQGPAQKITGIWRGYFSSSNGMYREGLREEMYKYEIQIEQLPNNGVRGVTYSYKSTIFYGKATLQGIYNVTSKTLLLKETKLVDLKVGDKSEPCLMTCYLDYSKVGKLEVLQGTFISTNVKDKGDCGSGKVYLEKVPVSDFEKEDFLTRHNDSSVAGTKKPAKKEAGMKDTAKKNTVSGSFTTAQKPPANRQPSTAGNTNPPRSTQPKTNTSSQPVAKNIPKTNKLTGAAAPKEAGKLSVPPPATPKVPAQPYVQEQTISSAVKPKEEYKEKNNGPIPKVLLERENKLVKTIHTDEELVQIDLFDNGTIDNDTISVYHNNVQVVKNARLSFSPISFRIRNNETDHNHELVVVAENLGEIPPNTALMVITAGRKRYEIFLASNEERNAKVVIQYSPKRP